MENISEKIDEFYPEPQDMATVDEISPQPPLQAPPGRLVRKFKLMHHKIMKKFIKGHSPRKIAHEMGYININEGEDEVRRIIKSYIQ